MIVDWLLVLTGLALLVGGGEALVRGASGVALIARVAPAVVGLTIVAAGTSMPEFVVSTQAAIEGSPGLAIGNVVGSNIFNIGGPCAAYGIVACSASHSDVDDCTRLFDGLETAAACPTESRVSLSRRSTTPS